MAVQNAMYLLSCWHKIDLNPNYCLTLYSVGLFGLVMLGKNVGSWTVGKGFYNN
jgi:hypothetical protein